MADTGWTRFSEAWPTKAGWYLHRMYSVERPSFICMFPNPDPDMINDFKIMRVGASREYFRQNMRGEWMGPIDIPALIATMQLNSIIPPLH